MLFIDTSIIFNILLYLFFSVFVVVGRRARVAFVAETSLCAWRRLHLFSARVLLRPSLNAQIHFACGGARVYLRVCVSVRYNTVRQAGKPSKRASGSVRASRRAHCTHFGSIRTCSKPLRNIYVLATCRVIGWQHVAYCPAAYSVLPCPGIMLCVDLTEQHSQCCQGLATYSVLLRCITLATFVAQPLHLENFYDPVLRVGR